MTSGGPSDPFEERLGIALRRYADDGIRGWPESPEPPARDRAPGLGRLLAYGTVGMLAVIVTLAGLAFAGSLGGQPQLGAQGSQQPIRTLEAGLSRFVCQGPPGCPSGTGWSFDYPATWRYFSAANLPPSSFSLTLGYLATIDLDVSSFCQQTNNGFSCNYQYPLTPGTLVVEIASGGFPNSPLWNGDTPAGQKRVMVAGMPALYAEQHLAADVDILSWQIARPDAFDNYYVLTAHIKGPGGGALRREVQALVASFRFDPPVVPLSSDPSAAARAAAGALAFLRALKPEGSSYACFPDVPGTSRGATIHAFPNIEPGLHKPLPVVCSMTIEPTDLQVWKMTLQFSWDAAADRQAGRYVITLLVTRTGELGASESGGPLSTQLPYQ